MQLWTIISTSDRCGQNSVGVKKRRKSHPVSQIQNNKIHHNVKIKLVVNAIKEQVMHLALSGHKIRNDLF